MGLFGYSFSQKTTIDIDNVMYNHRMQHEMKWIHEMSGQTFSNENPQAIHDAILQQYPQHYATLSNFL